jgi:Ca2+-binding EF-hand superfamily protein
MPEKRMAIIIQTFDTIDVEKKGYVSVEFLRETFKAAVSRYYYTVESSKSKA